MDNDGSGTVSPIENTNTLYNNLMRADRGNLNMSGNRVLRLPHARPLMFPTAAILVSATLLTGCALPVTGTTETRPQTSTDLTVDDIRREYAESAAIAGTLIAVQQIPQDITGLAGFQDIIDLTKKDSTAEGTLDLGVTGNKLVDYTYTKDGTKGPICVAMSRSSEDTFAGPDMMKNQVWVLYLSSFGDEKGIAVLKEGLSTCEEAKSAAENASTQDTQRAFNQIIMSLSSLPVGMLTKQGLELASRVLIQDDSNSTNSTGGGQPSSPEDPSNGDPSVPPTDNQPPPQGAPGDAPDSVPPSAPPTSYPAPTPSKTKKPPKLPSSEPLPTNPVPPVASTNPGQATRPSGTPKPATTPSVGPTSVLPSDPSGAQTEQGVDLEGNPIPMPG